MATYKVEVTSTASDCNDNVVDSISKNKNKDHAAVAVDLDNDLFPELNELSMNPAKFLSPNHPGCEDVGDVFQNESFHDEDIELLNYMTCKVNDCHCEIYDRKQNRAQTPIMPQTEERSVKISDGDGKIFRSFVCVSPVSLGDSAKNTGQTRSGKILVRVPRPKVKEPLPSVQIPSPLLDDESDDSKGLSRQAVLARQNRLKKKKYIGQLEDSVQSLTAEKTMLSRQVGGMQKQIHSLQQEVQYLTSVISNQGALAAVLKNVCSTPGVRFRGSNFTRQGGESDTMDSDDDLCVESRNKRSCLVDLRGAPSIMAEPAETELVQEMTGKTGKENYPSTDHEYASESPVMLRRANGRMCTRRNSSGSSGVGRHKSGGVCLHVADNNVSIEFCSHCNQSSISRVK